MAKDRYQYFRVEARELLDGLSRGILELEKAPEDKGLVARLLRLAHTLKGAARVVQQQVLGDLAHAAEDALGPHRDAGSPARTTSTVSVGWGLNTRPGPRKDRPFRRECGVRAGEPAWGTRAGPRPLSPTLSSG